MPATSLPRPKPAHPSPIPNWIASRSSCEKRHRRFSFLPCKNHSSPRNDAPKPDRAPPGAHLQQAAQLLLGARAPVVVFKEHPCCPRRYPLLHAQAAASGGALRFANGNATGDLIAGAQGVVTLNSSVGVESLLLGKPVLALGNAIYAIDGVAQSARSVQALADWLGAVADDAKSQAPLRQAFLRYMADEQLLPGRHQAPTDQHIERARDKLVQWGLG